MKVSPARALDTTGLLVDGDWRIFIEPVVVAISAFKQGGYPATVASLSPP